MLKRVVITCKNMQSQGGVALEEMKSNYEIHG